MLSCMAALSLTTHIVLATSAAAGAIGSEIERAGRPWTKKAKPYSGMYTFLKEGEFVQITVEDEFSVSGFISRFGESESDKGTFLDQFFKTGKLEGNKLTFTTQLIHGVGFDFKGDGRTR